jgi:hypothetical protein
MGQGQQVIHLHDLLVHFRKILDLWLQLFMRICKVDCRFIKFLQANFYKPNRICCRLIWFQWPYYKAMMHLHIINWMGSFVDVVELSIGVISWVIPTIFNSYVATNRPPIVDFLQFHHLNYNLVHLFHWFLLVLCICQRANLMFHCLRV